MTLTFRIAGVFDQGPDLTPYMLRRDYLEEALHNPGRVDFLWVRCSSVDATDGGSRHRRDVPGIRARRPEGQHREGLHDGLADAIRAADNDCRGHRVDLGAGPRTRRAQRHLDDSARAARRAGGLSKPGFRRRSDPRLARVRSRADRDRRRDARNALLRTRRSDGPAVRCRRLGPLLSFGLPGR